MEDMKTKSRDDYAKIYKSRALLRSKSAGTVKEMIKVLGLRSLEETLE